MYDNSRNIKNFRCLFLSRKFMYLLAKSKNFEHFDEQRINSFCYVTTKYIYFVIEIRDVSHFHECDKRMKISITFWNVIITICR